MSDLIKKLEHYFATTPREKVLEDWEKSKEWDKVGPTVDEFLKNNVWTEEKVTYKYVRMRRRPSLLQQRKLKKMDINKIRKIVNSDFDDDVCSKLIIQVLTDDKKVIPTILKIIEEEREQSKELLLDTNERLSVAFFALTKHSDGTRMSKSVKEWREQVLKDTIKHYNKWKDKISCSLNMSGFSKIKELEQQLNEHMP